MMKSGERRYVGIDLGKRTYTMAVIGKSGKVSHSNGRTDGGGRAALYRKLEKSDKVSGPGAVREKTEKTSDFP
ncbi:MAG: hypothetical protein LBK62_13025 [Treponema sp.]|jgi:hypothetical protein|nr:hypothetical protein [Treponema sp.]